MSKRLIKGDASPTTQGVYVVRMGLTSARAADYQKFTLQHLNQKVQILLGTNVVAEPIVSSEATNGIITLYCLPDEIKKITEPFPRK